MTMGPVRYLQYLFFLSACASLQAALGRVADAANLGITGGHKISIQNATYMAGLFNSCGFLCVGSIVHESFLLTTVNCADRTIVNYTTCGPSKAEVNNAYHTIHHKTCYRHKFCLLKLDNPLTFSKFVGKVQLPLQNDPVRAGTVLDLTGWGSKDVERHPETLMRAKIVVKSFKDCPRLKDLFCAGPSPSATGDFSDDEGAPVTIDNVQVGIGSIQLKSALGHRYYIGVSQFTHWINVTVQENIF